MLKRKFLLGLIAGVAIVLISGVLFSLDKGYETRKRIRKKGREFVNNFRVRLHRYRGAGAHSAH
jgi:gas vesicle protein